MIPAELHRITRAIHDLKAQEEKLISCPASAIQEEAKEFIRFHLEVKKYIQQKTADQEVLNRLNEMPDLEKVLMDRKMKSMTAGIWTGLFGNALMRNELKKKFLEAVKDTTNLYSSIEFILRSKS